tara:strand:- start:82 stop:477 length:396 start_codon:yes stop_codon:yes gene_type:complete
MSKLTKSEAEWRQQLTPEQFHITREAGTEAPFSGLYCDTKSDGVYKCLCCGEILFDSRTKYDSGSGWPSFFEPVSENVVVMKEDNSLGMQRVEVLCANCDSHLGHVFPDGPRPTGLRYCLNSVSLELQDRD